MDAGTGASDWMGGCAVALWRIELGDDAGRQGLDWLLMLICENCRRVGITRRTILDECSGWGRRAEHEIVERVYPALRQGSVAISKGMGRTGRAVPINAS